MSETDAALASAADDEPPGLNEPLVKLHSAGIQSAIAWVHNVVTSLAAHIEADREQQALTEKELRADDRQLRERLDFLEQTTLSSPLAARKRTPMSPPGGAGTAAPVNELPGRLDGLLDDVSRRLNSLESGMGPAEGEAGKEFALEVRQLADRMQRLEENSDNLREQQAHKLKAQDELISMRLETIEVELTSCLKAKDLDALRHQVDGLKTAVDKERTPDTLRAVEQELKGELHSRAVTLQKDLQAITDAVNEKLSLFEEQLEQLEAMSPGVEGAPSVATATADGDTGSPMATVKLNKQVRDLDRRVEDLAESQRLLRDLLDRSVPLGPPMGQVGERRLSNRSINIGGGDLFQSLAPGSTGNSPPNTAGQSNAAGLSPPNTASQANAGGRSPPNTAGQFQPVAATASDAPGAEAKDKSKDEGLVTGQAQMAKLADEVDSKLDNFAKRINALESDIDQSRPTSAAAPLSADLSHLKDLASRVDGALDNMSNRITALESGGVALVAAGQAPATATAPVAAESSSQGQAAARGLPEAVEAKALTSAPAQQAAAQGATSASAPAPAPEPGQHALPQLTEFASKMDQALSDVSKRIGNLEKAQGTLEKEVEAVSSRPPSQQEASRPADVAPAASDTPAPLMEYASRVDRELEKMSQRIAELERERRNFLMQQANQERGSSGIGSSDPMQGSEVQANQIRGSSGIAAPGPVQGSGEAAAVERSLPSQLQQPNEDQQRPGSRLSGDVANARLDQIEAHLSRCVRPEDLVELKRQVVQEIQLNAAGLAGDGAEDAGGLPSAAVATFAATQAQRDLPFSAGAPDSSAAPAGGISRELPEGISRELPEGLLGAGPEMSPAGGATEAVEPVRGSSPAGGSRLENRVSRLESEVENLLQAAIAGLEAPQLQGTGVAANPSTASGVATGAANGSAAQVTVGAATGAPGAAPEAARAARADPLAAIEKRVHDMADHDRATELADLAKKVEELARRAEHTRESQEHELEAWKARTELVLGQELDNKVDGLRQEFQAASTAAAVMPDPSGEATSRASAPLPSADPEEVQTAVLTSRLAKVEVELRELHQTVASVSGGVAAVKEMVEASVNAPAAAGVSEEHSDPPERPAGVPKLGGNDGVQELAALAESIQAMGPRLQVLEEWRLSVGEGGAAAAGDGAAAAAGAAGGAAAGSDGGSGSPGGAAAGGRAAGIASGGAADPDSAVLGRSGPSERTMQELDRMTEARLSAMWTELAGHAEAAAVRADALERNLMARLGKIENTVSVLHSPSEKKKKKREEESSDANLAAKFNSDKELLKSFEWLNWRISWLEWRTDGEKRSFARPLDAKAILPSPPPSTIAAPCFGQPITEDVELWTRDRTNPSVQRLRRRVEPQPGGFGQPGPQADTLGVLRPSQSTGTLPRLRG